MKSTSFQYSGTDIHIAASYEGDHILGKIQKGATFYEYDLLSAIEVLCSRSGLFVDVGAHIGNHSIFFSKIIGLSGYAVEPHFASFSDLIENIKRNGIAEKVQAIHGALWGSPIQLANVGHPEGNSGMNSVAPASHLASAATDDAMNFMSTTLDSIVAPSDRVEVLKIDVEGAEVEVLMGARRVLTHDRPIVAVEARTDADSDVLRTILSHEYGYLDIGTFCATATHLFVSRGTHAESALPRLTQHLSRTLRHLRYK